MADSSSQNQHQSPPRAAGVKRKRPHETKFYAVRVGRIPGIYSSWPECLEQVRGHKNALFQAFPSRTAAEAFVSGNPSTPKNIVSSTKSNAPTKFYGVRVGRRPGVYTDWPSAQAQIVGWRAPKHRKFDTRAEAEAYVAEGQVTNRLSSADHSKEGRTRPNDGAGIISEDQTAPLDVPGPWTLPPGAEDAFDPNVKVTNDGKVRYKTLDEKSRTKIVPTGSTGGSSSSRLLRIYTDGSSLNNGQGGAVGGVGVYFGPGHKSNVSEPLPGPRQTNQRAELTALLRALEIAPLHRPVEIYTDSRYAIGCITQWYDNWVRNGWITAKGAKVENKDLISEVKRLVDERKNIYRAETTFIWVKGHATDEGNKMADRLAVQGAHGTGILGGAKWEDVEDDIEYGKMASEMAEPSGVEKINVPSENGEQNVDSESKILDNNGTVKDGLDNSSSSVVDDMKGPKLGETIQWGG